MSDQGAHSLLSTIALFDAINPALATMATGGIASEDGPKSASCSSSYHQPFRGSIVFRDPSRWARGRPFHAGSKAEPLPGRKICSLLNGPCPSSPGRSSCIVDAPPARFFGQLLGLLLIGGAVGACNSGPSGGNVQPPPSHLDSLSTTSTVPPEEGAAPKLVRSQTLYVPAYSHIYYRNAQRSMNLATTLSIRNASAEVPLVLTTIEYYDSSGERVRAYLDTARVLDPLASTYVVVDVSDIRGGVGANFIVRWYAETPVSPPVVETVMITTESTQGISFRSPARVLYEDRVSAADTLSSRQPRP
jgi:hypothetical protein